MSRYHTWTAMKKALKAGIHTLEIAVRAGLDGFTEAEVNQILAGHVTLKQMRQAVALAEAEGAQLAALREEGGHTHDPAQ